MDVFAAVMTSKGVGAISTVQVFGSDAEKIVKKIFTPASRKITNFEQGRIYNGSISDENNETIDYVTIGCEGVNNFAIHCHGNPLIVTAVMGLLRKNGSKLLTVEQLMAKIIAAKESINTIALEAKVAQLKAKTLAGSKIINNQITAGLNKTAVDWLEIINDDTLGEIKESAKKILDDSRSAKWIIFGCKAVITGPPNSGKSSLLNKLAGKQKAIVTNIKGTTRDYVTAECQMGGLVVELIDTAGLDGRDCGIIGKQSQQKSYKLLEEIDLVLLVLDGSKTEGQLDDSLCERLASKKVITILNKSDLQERFNTKNLPHFLKNFVKVSAKTGEKIEEISKNIKKMCNYDLNFDICVCVTSRQEELLKKLTNSESGQQGSLIIKELLDGKVSF